MEARHGWSESANPPAPRAYRAVRLLREDLPCVPVVLGGLHPTFMYREALDSGADYVVLGEGELATLDLVETLEERGRTPSTSSG